MPSFIPRFKLYDSTGLNLIYQFIAVQATNAPQSVKKTVEIKGQRGKGGLIIDGGDDWWDLYIEGIIMAVDGYEDLIVSIDALESAVVLNTPYILKIDKTVSTYYEYKVKRIEPITYSDNLRTDSQEYRIILKVNSW